MDWIRGLPGADKRPDITTELTPDEMRLLSYQDIGYVKYIKKYLGLEIFKLHRLKCIKIGYT